MNILERWRRWRRWRRVRAHRRPWYYGEFGALVREADCLIASATRRRWSWILRRERERADADHRRRMRGGIDVPGLP
jgi:ribonuclease HI